MERYRLSAEDKTVLDRLPIPLAVYQWVGQKVVTIYVSPACVRVFGLGSQEEARHLFDTDMYRDAHPDDVGRIADLAARFAVNGGTYNAVYRNRLPGQKEYHIIHAVGKHVIMPGGTQLAVVWYTDATKALEAADRDSRDRLEHNLIRNVKGETEARRVRYDTLTGLPNMTYFFELAEIARESLREQGKTPAMLYMDLNGFKYYNYRQGIASGDQLLQEMAELLRNTFGSERTARFDADHFTAVTEAEGLDERLDTLINRGRRLCHGISLPLRVGIFVDDGKAESTVGVACDRAKIACNTEKDIYQSQYFYFSDAMQEEMVYKDYVLSHLDEALAQHWIKDYYQPLVYAKTGLLCDEEALARWVSPRHGVITPDKFIPVLENAGLLYKMDLYMVDRSIEYIKERQKRGLQVVPVSVNLSERDFLACDMIGEISKRLDAAGLSKKMLTIEITERDIGRDPELLKKLIDELHAAGFLIWLDDFGSEYSSLNILQNYKFELIKLDMKFLRQFNKNKMSKLIIQSVLTLAANAGIETVAEGVETEEQVAFLREGGCTKLQGYFYSKPVPREEALER